MNLRRRVTYGWSRSDAEELARIVAANRGYLGRWMPSAPDNTVDSTLDFIRRARNQLENDDGFQAVIVCDGQIVGHVGFRSGPRVSRASREVECASKQQRLVGRDTGAVPLVDRSDSVLCLVDVQPGFFDHSLMTEGERQQAAGTVDRIAWLTGLAGLIEVPTIVVEEGAHRNGATDERVVERLSTGAVVESKSSFSLTGSDAALEALRATDRRTVVVVGFETDVCVAQSAIDLLEDGFRAVTLDDATFSTGRQHERGMRRMTQAGVEFNHCKGLILEWLRTIDYGRETWALAVERFGPFPIESPAS